MSGILSLNTEAIRECDLTLNIYLAFCCCVWVCVSGTPEMEYI